MANLQDHQSPSQRFLALQCLKQDCPLACAATTQLIQRSLHTSLLDHRRPSHLPRPNLQHQNRMHAGLVLGIVSGISSFCSATPLAFKGDVKPRPGYTIYNAYDIDLDSAEYGTCKVHRNRIWKAFSETAELINAGREAIVALRHPRPAEGEAAESWRRKVRAT